MASTYTTSGIELIASGEQSGTWGDTTNDNWEIVDLQLNSRLSKTLSTAGSSGSPNALTITDGDKTSEGMYASVVFVDGGDLGANAYVRLEPNDVKRQIWVRNSLSASRSIFLFQGTYNASNDIELLNGYDYLVSFDGAGAGAVVTQVNNSFPATTFGLTEDELTQLQNIDSTTVSTTQWGYLGAMNQGVTTTSNVTFGTITGTGDMAIDTDTLFVDVSADSVGIGTTTPGSTLEVHRSTDGNVARFYGNTSNFVMSEFSGITYFWNNGGEFRFGTSSAHSLNLGTNNSVRVTVDSSGSVGIGTTSPQRPFHVAGGAEVRTATFRSTGTGAKIEFADSTTTGGVYVGGVGENLIFETNGQQERVRIDSSGKVGIGTTPDRVLHVASNEPGLLMEESDHATADESLTQILSVNGDFVMRTLNDTLTVGSSFYQAIRSGVEITDHYLYVGTGGDDGRLHLRINSGVLEHRLVARSGDDVALYFGDLTDTVRAGFFYDTSANTLQFRGYNNSESFRIDSSGKVGIGTTSPDTELDVDGAIKGKVEVNTPVSGTLVTTTHLRGAINNINGNITMPAGEAGGHAVITNNSSTARTVSRHAGLANLFVNGTNVSSATISGRGVVGVIYTASSICHLSGDVS